MNPLPRHIAIIMDGNGRWAKARSLPRVMGHRAGVDALREVVEHAAGCGVEYLTLFAFSSENWSRPQQEIAELMTLFARLLTREIKKLHENNVCLKIIGDVSRFSHKLQDLIKQGEDLTAQNDGLQLNIAANYGGRWDILQACKKLIRQIDSHDHAAIANLDEQTFQLALSTAGIPDPDLFIRTSGEARLSNFLLWQLSYAELYFSDTLWPDFKKQHLDEAIEHFQRRDRRFGCLSDVVNHE